HREEFVVPCDRAFEQNLLPVGRWGRLTGIDMRKLVGQCKGSLRICSTTKHEERKRCNQHFVGTHKLRILAEIRRLSARARHVYICTPPQNKIGPSLND